MKYQDADGNPCTLDQLCKRDPAWAANHIRHLDESGRGILEAGRVALRYIDDRVNIDCTAYAWMVGELRSAVARIAVALGRQPPDPTS